MHYFRDHSYRQCHTASACNYTSENKTINSIWGESDYYNQKLNRDLSFNIGETASLPPSAPSLVFERNTYTAYYIFNLDYQVTGYSPLGSTGDY